VESEKNTSALGEEPGEPENQYPTSGRIPKHPRSLPLQWLSALAALFTRSLSTFSRAPALSPALSLSAAAFDVLPVTL